MLRPIMLANYLGTLSSLGFSEQDVLADTRIDPAALATPAYLVSCSQYRRLFENLASLKDFPGLGLEFGLRSGLADAGVLGYATLSCRSARQSMEDLWARYGTMLGMMASPLFNDDDRHTVSVEFSVPTMSEAAYRLCIEDALCRIAGTGGAVVGNKAVFEQISFSYSAPAYCERYREIFQCPLVFNAPRTRAVIRRDWMDHPLKTHDEALLGIYLQRLGRVDEQIKNTSPLADQVREHLLRCENISLPSQTEVANNFGLSGRTFCRELQKQGSSYRGLVEEARFERVLASLDSGQATAKQIAYRAGYQNLSAFRRAFKKWTKQTVQEYQKEKGKQCIAAKSGLYNLHADPRLSQANFGGGCCE